MFQIATAAIHSTKVCNRKGKSNILSCSKSLFIAKGERPSIDQTVTLSTHLYQIMCSSCCTNSMDSKIQYFVALEPLDDLQSSIALACGMKRTTRSTRQSMKERNKPNHQTTKTTQQPGRKPVLWVECFFPKIEICLGFEPSIEPSQAIHWPVHDAAIDHP